MCRSRSVDDDDRSGFEEAVAAAREADVAVLVMGSTGEVSMLTPEERHKVVRETIRMKTGKMEFWYGCTGPSTAATIAYVRQAADEGADGAIIAAPSYICAPEDDIVEYFLEVADASPENEALLDAAMSERNPSELHEAVAAELGEFTGPMLMGPPEVKCGQFADAPAVCNSLAKFYAYQGRGVFTPATGWLRAPA